MVYPQKFSSLRSQLVVEFFSLTSGKVLTSYDGLQVTNSEIKDVWTPHTNKKQWEKVKTYYGLWSERYGWVKKDKFRCEWGSFHEAFLHRPEGYKVIPIEYPKIEEFDEMTELATLKQQVKDMEATIARMEQEKPKQFEFNYVKCNTYRVYDIYIEDNYNGDSSAGLEHGRYRRTKEVAEHSMARNKRANRLEAVAEQLGGLEEWSTDFCRATIFLADGKWQYNYFIRDSFHPEKVYMTKDCAIIICHMLNTGEFEL